MAKPTATQRAMDGANKGSIGGPYGAAGGAIDGYFNGPIYKEITKGSEEEARDPGAEIMRILGVSGNIFGAARKQDYFSSFLQRDTNNRAAQDALKLYPQLAEYEREQTTKGRVQDVADIRNYGPRLSATLDKLNPGWKESGNALTQLIRGAGARTPLLRQMNTSAMGVGTSDINQQLNDYALEQLALGDQIGADEQRQVVQDARAAASARGLFGGDAAALDEVMNLYGVRQGRQRERVGIAGNIQAGLLQEMVANRNWQAGVEGLNQNADQAERGFIAQANGVSQQRLDPILAILGRRSNISPTAGASMLNGPQPNSAGLLAQILGYGADAANTNFNSAAAQRIAGANNQAALTAAGIQAGSQIYGNYSQNKAAGASSAGGTTQLPAANSGYAV